jgi:hypothetical protein
MNHSAVPFFRSQRFTLLSLFLGLSLLPALLIGFVGYQQAAVGMEPRLRQGGTTGAPDP